MSTTNRQEPKTGLDRETDARVIGRSRRLLTSFLCLFCIAALAVPAGADISGTVFRDVDVDGVEDVGEPGIFGITVNAFLDGAAAPTFTTTTDVNGDYTLAILLGTATYRIEFGDSSATATYRSGPAGNTRVVFATNPATGVDTGLHDPLQFCQADPFLVTNCYIDGDQTLGEDVLISFAYTESGESDVATIGDEALDSDIGTTWGLAHQRAANIMFASSFAKRHAGYGDIAADGTGVIWSIPNPSNGVIDVGGDAPSEFVNLNDLFAGAFGTNTHQMGTNFGEDFTTYPVSGKTSMGDMDISDDDLTLWLINLEDRELWEVSLGTDPTAPAVPTAGDVSIFALGGLFDCEGDGIGNNPDLRPFGIKYHDGRVYVGAVCTTELEGDDPATEDTGLRALVFRFDPATDTFDATPAVNFLLNYDRGCLLESGGSCTGGGTDTANWQGWEDDFDSASVPRQPEGTIVMFTAELGYPQPIVADIEFALDGTMILGLRDRFGDMMGRDQTFPDGTSVGVGDADAVGDILRALDTDGDGVYAVSSIEATDGTEFFPDDDWTDTTFSHAETVWGGLTVWTGDPGTDAVATQMDPLDGPGGGDNDFAGGLRWYDWASGTTDQRLEVYDPDNAGPDVFFGKSNGLGDVEAVCDAAPIEIGNRVWNDLDRDGVQDPGESGINGLTVFLFEDPDGIPDNGDEIAQGSVVTAGDGNYTFAVDPNTNYYVQLTIPAGFGATIPDALQIGDGNDDARDSDGLTGIVAGDVVASFTTGGPGDNDHTKDLGFRALEFDWGDLPDGPYATLAASTGPNHEITSVGNVFLGPAGDNPDSELDGQPNATATGDDGDLNGDDEDGVVFLTPLNPGDVADINVTASGVGVLNAWIDFNSDGAFTGEQIATNLAVVAGVNLLDDIPVPAGATGIMAARFRVTNLLSQGGDSPTGPATTGEVEDYVLSSLGDFVWNDSIVGMGIQVGGDTPVPGVVVNLLAVDGVTPILSGDGTAITTTTDVSGNYEFPGLPPGSYRVRFDIPVGFVDFSPRDATVDTLDSDADQITSLTPGLSQTVVLAVGVSDIDLDAGLRAVTAALITSTAAYNDGGSVVFEFSTGYEALSAGFEVYRFDQGVEDYVPVTEGMITSLLGSPQGGVYRVTDEQAPFSEKLSYMVVEHQADGGTRAYGPYTVELEGRGDRARLEESVTALPHVSKRLKQRVAQARREAAVNASPAASLFVAPRAAVFTALVDVRDAGLYYVSSAEIAATLGLPESKVRQTVRRGGVVVENQGRAIAWLEPDGSGDGLYFYGEAIDSLYTLDNAYWLRVGRPGVPMEGDGQGLPTAAPGGVFSSTERFEEDLLPSINATLETEVDFWYWDGINAASADRIRTFDVTVPDSVAGNAVITARFTGATNGPSANDHHAIVRINGVEVGTAIWGGMERFEAEMAFDSSLLTPLTTIEVEGTLAGGSSQSIFFIDGFDIEYSRTYHAVADSLFLTGDGNAVVTVEGISSADVVVFDLSDPALPKTVSNVLVEVGAGGFQASFVPSGGSTPYLVTTLTAARAGLNLRPYSPAIQLIAGHHRFDHVVIAPAAWITEAEDLAAYRSSQGLSSLAVSIEEVYNAFSWGNPTPWAIRDFLAYARANWVQGPNYAVIAGRGTFDGRNLLGDGDSFVPVVLVGTRFGLVSTDNVLADLEGNDAIPELAIGRLPIVSGSELATYLDKLEAYDASGGDWRGRAILLADDPDRAGNFPAQSDDVAALLGSYSQELIYLSELDIGTARAALQAAWNNGAQLVNYIGHGGVTQAAAEGLLRVGDMDLLTNGDRLPVVSALTCVVGRSDIPSIESLAEALVTDVDGGAIAVWAPTGLSLSSAAHELNLLYADRLEAAAADTALGDIVLEVLSAFGKGGGSIEMLNAYSITGDPAVQLP